MTNNYVVYLHERLDKPGHIFYCGSGKPNRPYVKTKGKSGRNKYWHNIAKDGYNTHIIASGLTKEESLCTEGFLTREHQDAGMCEACFQIPVDGTYKEHTEGSRQNMKKPKSEEHCKNIGLAKRCNTYGKANRGQIRSKETREKISKVQTGIKKSEESIAKRVKANTGKKRSNEFRQHLSEVKKGKPNGSKGYRWITNGIENRKIKDLTLMPDGFYIGKVYRTKNK